MEMSRPTLSAIEVDKRLVWAEEITKFAEMYRVSATEFLYGFADELPEIEIDAVEESQSSRLVAYSPLYGKLNEKNQKKILKIMEDLIETQKR